MRLRMHPRFQEANCIFIQYSWNDFQENSVFLAQGGLPAPTPERFQQLVFNYGRSRVQFWDVLRQTFDMMVDYPLALHKLSLLAGIAIGAVLTAGVAQLRAQAPASATTTRPAVFVITEQTFIDEKKYMDEFAGKAVETIKAAGGRFIVRANEVTKLSGDAPNRLVITGWESLDDVKKWQAGEYAKLIPIWDQYAKVRSFAVPTCENPQGAKPGQTKCPF